MIENIKKLAPIIKIKKYLKIIYIIYKQIFKYKISFNFIHKFM